MGESILIAISKWVVKNFKVSESLKETGTEILQTCLWAPLKEKIVKFFSTEKEAQKFIEKISETGVKNEQKPQRDVEDVYEDVKEQEGIPDKELFNTIAGFFRDNQELIKQINATNNNREGKDTNIFDQKADVINNGKYQTITFNYNHK